MLIYSPDSSLLSAQRVHCCSFLHLLTIRLSLESHVNIASLSSVNFIVVNVHYVMSLLTFDRKILQGKHWNNFFFACRYFEWTICRKFALLSSLSRFVIPKVSSCFELPIERVVRDQSRNHGQHWTIWVNFYSHFNFHLRWWKSEKWKAAKLQHQKGRKRNLNLLIKLSGSETRNQSTFLLWFFVSR